MSGRTALIQQQQLDPRLRLWVAPIVSDPWQWWTPVEIASITNTPSFAVVTDWPIVWEALVAYGLADYDTVRAVLATIAIETAHTFKPVQEAFWLDDAWRYANLRYAPYWGRGYVQLTWKDNYAYYGWRIGHPEIVDFPTKALDSFIAAQLLAVYFSDKGIQVAAQRQDWYECRRLVQGGYAGIDEFVRIIHDLDAAKATEPQRLSHVLDVAYAQTGLPYVWDGDNPADGGFDCSGLVSYAYEDTLTSYTDAIFDETVDVAHPTAGDVCLYEYYDPNQQNTRFPHVGLWLNEQETLDSRYGYGVGVHPHVKGARMFTRRVPGVVVDTRVPRLTA